MLADRAVPGTERALGPAARAVPEQVAEVGLAEVSTAVKPADRARTRRPAVPATAAAAMRRAVRKLGRSVRAVLHRSIRSEAGAGAAEEAWVAARAASICGIGVPTQSSSRRLR
jgi:acyl-CoA reductase-like NAD-dependent aldehyde dehydrogenase